MESTSQANSLKKLTRRLLIIDSTLQKYAELKVTLQNEGWDIEITNDKNTAIALATNFQPTVVIMNLFMQSSSTLKLLREVKSMLNDKNAHIIIVTSHYSESNIKQSLSAGANDFILEPFETRMLIERIKFQLQEKASFELEKLSPQSAAIEADFKLMYECLRILSEMSQSQVGIFETLKRIGEFSKSPRVNIMTADLGRPKAIVIASSDDANFQNVAVELDRYPEVREVLLKNHIIYIKDISSNPLTADIQNNVKSININSLLVLPIRHRGETFGSLSIRLSADSAKVTETSVKTFFMLAMCLAPKIAAKKMLLDKDSAN